MSKIYGSATGGFGMPKTLVLTDKNGNEFTGVVTGQKTVFTATKDDVKTGKIFASDEGVQTGADTKTYRTTQGMIGISAGSSVSIPLSHYEQYDYTKFQCIITNFNTDLTNSTAAIKISLNDSIYNVDSTDIVSNVSKNTETKSIDLNFVNNTNNVIVVHYFTYKQEV